MWAFESQIKPLGKIPLPTFTGTRIMMMPVIHGDIESLPTALSHYRQTIRGLFAATTNHAGKVGYLTIDEKRTTIGGTHRRAGLHVDGIYRGGGGSWGGGWGAVGAGMVTVASHVGCRAWAQEFKGSPDNEGGCEFMRDQC
ncbi:unnamed protein product, partial [Phaeothamnion confervicola]